MLNRKAISPLIATVILVAFAVSLGALVIDWNTKFVNDVASISKEQSSTKLSCQFQLGVMFSEMKGQQQICFRNTTGIELTLQNNEKLAISDVKARVATNNSIYGMLDINLTSGGLMNVINGGEAKRGVIAVDLFNGTTETIQEVVIIPGIKVDKKLIYCFDSAIVAESPLNGCD